MRIEILIWSEETELHLWSRHRITAREAEDAAYEAGLILRGREKDLYGAYGRTEAGRYLVVVVRKLGNSTARLITAREMTWTERRRYEKHTAH